MTRASAAHTESCLDEAGWRGGAGGIGRPAVGVRGGGRWLWAPRVATSRRRGRGHRRNPPHLPATARRARDGAAGRSARGRHARDHPLHRAQFRAPVDAEGLAGRSVSPGSERRSSRTAADRGVDRPQWAGRRRRSARRPTRDGRRERASRRGQRLGRHTDHRRSRRRPLRRHAAAAGDEWPVSFSPLRSRRTSPAGAKRRPSRSILLASTVALFLVAAGLYTADARARLKRNREDSARRASVEFGAQSRPLRTVDLGYRPRPYRLVGLDVRRSRSRRTAGRVDSGGFASIGSSRGHEPRDDRAARHRSRR